MIELIEIGRNIMTLRKAKGYSVERVALESNLSPAWLRQIESGQASITVDTLRRIANTLKVAPIALGILALPDERILSMLQKAPQIPRQASKEIQIGRNIVSLRKERGLTQKQLAQAAGVSSARLREVEQDCANVTIALLGRLAKALEVPLLIIAALAIPEEEILAMARDARIQVGMVAA